MVEEVQKEVRDRYTVLKLIGKKSTGLVWEAVDNKYNRRVAIKKIYDAFSSISEAQTTYREIMYLQELKGHENIILLRNIISSSNNKDLFLVFEYIEANLLDVIQNKLLKDIHNQYIIYQILKVIKYMHSAKLVHGNLKPSKILINSDCLIKIIEFVYTRLEVGTQGVCYYVSRGYHTAPEILFGSEQQSKAVDMWAIGCILGELILGKPVFPGASTLNQIERVGELLGRPTIEDIEAISSPYTSLLLSSIDVYKKYSFEDFFPQASDDARDLLKRLLVYNPYERFTVEEALNHIYLASFVSKEEEIVCDHAIELKLDNVKNPSIQDYRDAVDEEMHKLNPSPTKNSENAKPKTIARQSSENNNKMNQKDENLNEDSEKTKKTR